MAVSACREEAGSVREAIGEGFGMSIFTDRPHRVSFARTADSGRVRMPRPSARHGIAATPNICMGSVGPRADAGAQTVGRGAAHFESRREHLARLFAVDKAVVILH